MSVALRLQVAIKLAKEDEQTLSALLIQAEESKSREMAATKRADEAVTLIRALTLEVNTLKRKLKAFETENFDKNAGSAVMSLQQQQAMNELADVEVDGMLGDLDKIQTAPRDISTVALASATPFDKWKMSNFLFSPDTPAASAAHDKHVVDLLMESATQQLIGELRTKRTKASIGKLKKLEKRIVVEQDIRKMQATTSIPANDFDGLQISEDAAADAADYSTFFLSPAAEQRWGNRVGFDHNNMARMNLWNAGDPLHSVTKSPGKLKSLHHRDGASGGLTSLSHSTGKLNI